MKPNTFKMMISTKLGLPYDCYIGYFDGGARIDDIQNGCLSKEISTDFFTPVIFQDGSDSEMNPDNQ